MNEKKFLQYVFDRAAIQLAQEGRIPQKIYGLVKDNLVPIDVDSKILNNESIVHFLAKKLDEIQANAFLVVSVGSIKFTEFKKNTTAKNKKKKEETLEQDLVLFTALKKKVGNYKILYSKLTVDPRGVPYPLPEEKWVDEAKNVSFFVI